MSESLEQKVKELERRVMDLEAKGASYGPLPTTLSFQPGMPGTAHDIRRVLERLKVPGDPTDI